MDISPFLNLLNHNGNPMFYFLNFHASAADSVVWGTTAVTSSSGDMQEVSFRNFQSKLTVFSCSLNRIKKKSWGLDLNQVPGA